MKIKNRKFQKNGDVAATDEKYTGVEASWRGVDTKEAYDKKLSSALNFYNYYLDRDDYIPIIHEYMTAKGYDKNDLQLIKGIPKTSRDVTITGKLCRMFNRGAPDYYNYRGLVQSKIASMLKDADEVKKAKA